MKRTPSPPDPRLQKVGPGTRCAAMQQKRAKLRCRMSGVSKFKGLAYCETHLRQAVRGVIATSPDAERDPEDRPEHPEGEAWPPPLREPPPEEWVSTLGSACPLNWVKRPRRPVELSTALSRAELDAADRWARIDAQIITVPCRLITIAEDVRPFHQLHVGELR